MKSLENSLNSKFSEGIDAIIVCGTTGESATMSTEEKKEVIKFAVDVAKKRVPIIAGTGSNNTYSAIEMSKYAESVGVDGLLVVTPFYNKATQERSYRALQTYCRKCLNFQLLSTVFNQELV